MKKSVKLALALGASAAIVLGSVVPASAVSTGLLGHNCTWPTHAFLEMRSSGTQTIKVKATGGAGWSSNYWGNSATVRRNYVNSLTEDSAEGYIETSGSLNSYGWGCSI